MEKIIFKIGEESKPVVEGLNEYSSSIFRSYYKTAIDVIFNIIKEDNKTQKSDANSNIITFIGERGAGKTSCMNSVQNLLKEAMNASGRTLPDGIDYHNFHETFEILDTIDPSFFDVKHNILELIIGTLFAKLKKCINERDLDAYANHTKLLHAFEEVKCNLLYVGDSKELNMDSLEELEHLSAGIQLKNSVKKLIEIYLDYARKKVLVISLDDIDLNTSQAYRMVEQIRKYLVIHNVIILMAIKIEQLSHVIQLELTKDFKELLLRREISNSEIQVMAERYITKLLPFNQRIILPSPEIYFETPLEIIDLKGEIKSYVNIKQSIPELIFKKTRYLFYNTKGSTSLVVPRNLRDLRLLIQLLYQLDNIKRHDKRIDVIKHNQETFKGYFFPKCLNMLSSESRKIAETIFNEKESVNLNKTVIQMLKYHFITRNKIYIPDKYEDIINIDNMSYNVSLGDVMAFIEYIENINLNPDTRLLIFLIRSYYSMRLYEAHKKFIEVVKHPFEEDSSKGKVYMHQNLEEYSDYEKILAGSVIYMPGDEFIPAKENGQNVDSFREIRLLNGTKLLQLIRDIKKSKISDKILKGGIENIDEHYIKQLHTAEFFMLTTNRYVWTVNRTLTESKGHKYRQSVEAYFDHHMSSNTRNILFDALTPLFTVLNIERSYSRFDNGIYNLAKLVPNSLVNRIYKNKERVDVLDVLSIRNMEILHDLILELRKNRRNLRSGDSRIQLSDFYKKLCNYKIDNYDVDDTAEVYCSISFECYKCLSEILETLSVNDFNSIYQEIYESDIAVEQYFKAILPISSKRGSVVMKDIEIMFPDFFRQAGGKHGIGSYFPDQKKAYTKNQVKDNLQKIIESNGISLSELPCYIDSSENELGFSNTDLTHEEALDSSIGVFPDEDIL